MTTWMDLEPILLSKINQRQILCCLTDVWNLKIKYNKFIRKKSHMWRGRGREDRLLEDVVKRYKVLVIR